MQEVKENILVAPLTSFQIGGRARYLVDVRSDNDLKEAIGWAKEKGVRFQIFGGGSNVLAPDEGVDALLIRFVGNLYTFEDEAVDSWAGTNLLFLIRAMATQGYGGWEKLAGIPGSVGGAVRGNAGAFGSEIKDYIQTVRAYNSRTDEMREFTNADCDFSYRHSFFKDHAEWLVLRAKIHLDQVAPEESAARTEETIRERERRHLQNVKAAGSYFMNPIAGPDIVAMFEQEKGVKSRGNRVPAGWLIEKAGMKGARVGDAVASHQHPNYIVNQGTATAKDVRALATKIIDVVRTKFGVTLEEEAAVL
jgi:UDP-N-acetylmuramate dehydrogenase